MRYVPSTVRVSILDLLIVGTNGSTSYCKNVFLFFFPNDFVSTLAVLDLADAFVLQAHHSYSDHNVHKIMMLQKNGLLFRFKDEEFYRTFGAHFFEFPMCMVIQLVLSPSARKLVFRSSLLERSQIQTRNMTHVFVRNQYRK